LYNSPPKLLCPLTGAGAGVSVGKGLVVAVCGADGCLGVGGALVAVGGLAVRVGVAG
jgi:hypothetical protein